MVLVFHKENMLPCLVTLGVASGMGWFVSVLLLVNTDCKTIHTTQHVVNVQ